MHLDAERIRALDAYGLTHLLSAFGGMGSLNDLARQPGDDQLGSLLDEIWRLAARLLAEEASTSPSEA